MRSRACWMSRSSLFHGWIKKAQQVARVSSVLQRERVVECTPQPAQVISLDEMWTYVKVWRGPNTTRCGSGQRWGKRRTAARGGTVRWAVGMRRPSGDCMRGGRQRPVPGGYLHVLQSLAYIPTSRGPTGSARQCTASASASREACQIVEQKRTCPHLHRRSLVASAHQEQRGLRRLPGHGCGICHMLP